MINKLNLMQYKHVCMCGWILLIEKQSGNKINIS